MARNVGRIAAAPRVPRREARTLTPDEARLLLAAAHGHDLDGFVAVGLACGLRRGEALALRWTDLDLDGSVLWVRATLGRRTGEGLVRGEPKTATSRRAVPIPAVCVEALRAHRAAQDGARRKAGAAWQETGYVFTSRIGTPIDPANVRNRFRALNRPAGLGSWNPHELRHSAASLLLAQGVPLKVVSDLLGHASIAVTADVYSHVLPALTRAVSDHRTSRSAISGSRGEVAVPFLLGEG